MSLLYDALVGGRLLDMKTVGGVFLALVALTCTGSACSDSSTSDGLRCTTSKRAVVAVDYDGNGGESSPLSAVSTYLSIGGNGLPSEGYEVDNTFQDDPRGTGGTPPSVRDPGQGTSPSMQKQTVVHRSKNGVDVAFEVTYYGTGWRVSSGTWCPEAQK